MVRWALLLACSVLATSAAAEPLRLQYDPLPSAKGCPVAANVVGQRVTIFSDEAYNAYVQAP